MREKQTISQDKALMEEWDFEVNAHLSPEKLTRGSNKKAWWKCSKCKYEYEAKISNRAILKRGCPCCKNKVVVVGINDLATTHPSLAKEWHPTKNGDLLPQNITYGYGKKVWWQCPYGHEYQATPNHRTQKEGTQCPICYSGRQTSFAEQAIFYYVKKLYPDAINRYKADFLGKMELDVYIPSIRYAIEYDGEAWHKERTIKREQRKYELCRKQGIKLIRLREKQITSGLDIADYCWHMPDLYKHKNLEVIIMDVLRRLRLHFCCSFVDINIERDRLDILSYATPIKESSFAHLYPQLLKEWHSIKNGTLRPDTLKPKSDHKVWWLCSVCGHEYEATIGHRVTGTGCIKCGIRKSALAKSKAVHMINIATGEIDATFESISEAGRQMKINSSNIAMVCTGKRNAAGGYQWRYVNKS